MNNCICHCHNNHGNTAEAQCKCIPNCEHCRPEQPKQEAYPNLNAGNPAPEGNQRALKFDTPEKRATMLHNYTLHCQKGYSDESFPDCDPQTFKKYVEKYPSEFDTEIIAEAKRGRRMFLEQIGFNGTMGIPATYRNSKGEVITAPGKFNDRSWKFIMQNMTGWKERTDVTSGDEKFNLPQVYIPKEDPTK